MVQHSAIVIGAGIVGLATARALTKKNFKVKVFERNERAVGASIRNFGMVLPVGQPKGRLRDCALYSRNVWKEICEEGNIWFQEAGSLLNVYHNDELVVIEEFYANNRDTYDCQILSAKEVEAKSPAVNPKNLKAALWSSTEIIVDPREAIVKLPSYLSTKYGIEFHFSKAVSHIEEGKVYCGKEMYEADLIFVCSGADFETLYPETYMASGMTKCKLQMLRTVPQENNWRIGPMLSAGLSLTHYAAFADCPSLATLQERYNRQLPDFIKWGIHVMISQNGTGEITIGDSHEYGLIHDPFDRDEINQRIIYYLHSFTQIQDLEIAQTWNGTYAKMKDKEAFIASPESGVYIFNGLGGAGMTLSFGLAEEVVSAALG